MKCSHVWILAIVGMWRTAAAQPPGMSLAQAQQAALQYQPRIASAAFEAQASQFAASEVRSAYYPTVSGNVTGVGTEHGSVLSAGAVTTSSMFSRGAMGLAGNQLLTDFGRTNSLVASARLRNESRNQNVLNTRAEVLVDVRESYYQALAAQAVRRVVEATLNLRRVTLRQVSALAASSLRSKVDVSFAQVAVSQAELDLIHAEDGVRASHARLSAAIGYERDQPFSLQDEPLPAPLVEDIGALIDEALRARPDLGALRLNRDALRSFASAEKDLRNPTITMGVAAGVAPVRDPRLAESYSGAGININIPVLNGGLFKARRQDADAHALAANKDVEALAVRISRDVQIAWLAANDAFQRLDVTAKLTAEADEALRLAQARYGAALGGIVELNQAQVNQAVAQVAQSTAKYEYLIRRAELDFATGALR